MWNRTRISSWKSKWSKPTQTQEYATNSNLRRVISLPFRLRNNISIRAASLISFASTHAKLCVLNYARNTGGITKLRNKAFDTRICQVLSHQVRKQNFTYSFLVRIGFHDLTCNCSIYRFELEQRIWIYFFKVKSYKWLFIGTGVLQFFNKIILLKRKNVKIYWNYKKYVFFPERNI